MMREIEALVRENWKWVRFRLLISMLSWEKCDRLRSILKKKIRRAKMVCIVVVIIKEEPNRFYKYIKEKRVTGE